MGNKTIEGLITDMFEKLSENIDEINKSIEKLGESLGNIEARQFSLEEQLNRDYNKNDNTFNAYNYNEKICCQAKGAEIIEKDQEYDENFGKKPIMPGAGFSNITPEFLKNLGRRP